MYPKILFYYKRKYADMVELVDTLDLGPSDFCFVGSSPTVCKENLYLKKFKLMFTYKLNSN